MQRNVKTAWQTAARDCYDRNWQVLALAIGTSSIHRTHYV